MIPRTSIEDGIKEIDGRPYHPVDVARVNDQVVRLALFKGDYHWHSHQEEDELFFVLRGKMTLQLEDHPDLTLNEGEMAVVPKGIKHRPVSDEGAYVLMFEPAGLKSKGD